MGKVVCVTGASGYIASWLVKLLLLRGYTVKATVRNLSDPQKVAHLTALEGADERLHLYEASLLEEGSFDSAVDGCEGVFHTASPVFLSVSVSDAQKELIDTAVKGTINVLESCKKVSSIKRIVVTSSMASVMFNYNPVTPDVIVDETWFSDKNFCEEKKQWYALSKTLAEKATWEFVEENGLDLVTLHPGFVIGPPLQPTLNLTSEAFLNLINGKELFADGVYRYVDVRDVALAHILAFENPSASGRYCLVGRVTHSSEVRAILTESFPSLILHGKSRENLPARPAYQVSKEEGKNFGHQFYSS
ncbi:UNVERIFIED_CONTAM: Cinnamoyl-CoA reductase 1 [Sesamum radiatum]|uniref:Dihydroflavonol 4-reductase n=1 Tax=Sesamum radiatum TaxID=300843 RepID=A0AAW2V9I1_SESRA